MLASYVARSQRKLQLILSHINVLIVNCTLSCRIPFNYLLVNLAAADISYAIFAVPNIILSHHVYHPEGLAGTLLCTTLTGGNLSWIGGRASMINLIVIAIERYFALVHPHGNKGKLTNRKLKVCDIQIYHYDCHNSALF